MTFCTARNPLPARQRKRVARSRRAAGIVAALLPLWLLTPVALAQVGFEDDEPILPQAISEMDVEMRGRYVRQWRDETGALILVFTGGFELEMGQRLLSSVESVVWISPRPASGDEPKHYELVVYLSDEAQVREIGGSTVEDRVLLVTDLRTSGRLRKRHDAHAPEDFSASDLFQRALADRQRIEALRSEGDAGGVVRPEEARKLPKPSPVIFYRLSGGVEPAQTEGGETVFVAVGGVYFAQTGSPDSAALVIQADNAVIFPAPGASNLLFADEAASESTGNGASSAPAATPLQGEADAGDAPPGPADAPGSLRSRIRGVYLEGDVVLTLGERVVRATRLYYDFELSRALMLDAVFRTDLPERGVPLYVRADEIRQLSGREFSAERARLSTSEFYTPHYHVGAERVYIRDRTPRDVAGQPSGPLRGEYELRSGTLNVDNSPLLWWPYSRGDLEQSETLLRRFRTGYSGDRGVEVETAWYLFNLLGLRPPPGYDATLQLDYLSERGPAAGVNADYQQADHFGLLRTYYIADQGEDNLGPLRRRYEDPDDENRGRVLWRHRHFLPNDWEVSLEFAYASDPYFLEEYEKSEWFEGKDQETAVYVKRAKEKDAITLLANWRLLDFTTQTEHLPELAYRRLADTFLSPLVLYHESRVGSVRYKLDDRRFVDRPRYSAVGDTDSTLRAGAREEAELPLKFPGFNIVPFGSFSGYFWDGMALRDGGLWRGLGVVGVRGSGWLARVFDEIQSDLFDVNRVRHIIQPHFVAWWAGSNIRSDKLTPFDEGVETADDFHGGVLGVRQTWQTKRGVGDKQRSVDLLTMNVEIGAFGEAQSGELSNGYANMFRPEDSRSRNYAAMDLIWRLSDTTSLLYDLNFDLNDGSADRHDVSLAIERNPRLSYVIGYRHAGDIDLDLVGGGWNYKLNEKHITSVRAWYDLDRGELGEIAVIYIRKLPRWYFAINVEFDEVFDDVKVGVSLWPEGIPEWTLGSRRFTGLTTSTGIKP